MAADRPDLSRAEWRKSTRSSSEGQNCVEIATNLPGIVAVRDSKDPDGPELVFTAAVWAAFVRGVKAGGPGRTGRYPARLARPPPAPPSASQPVPPPPHVPP